MRYCGLFVQRMMLTTMIVCLGEGKGEGEGEEGLQEGEVQDDEEGRDQNHDEDDLYCSF